MNRFAVIMAGGSGTRFWPKSRKDHPKQYLAITGEKSLIQETIARLDRFITPENIIIVISGEHKQLAMSQLPQVPEKNFLVEPVGRNTTACIALAAYHIQSIDQGAVMIVMPSDHKLLDQDAFTERAAIAFNVASKGENLVTFGIVPEYAETGYGYIEYGKPCFQELGAGILEVRRFLEKPDADSAWKYYSSGNYLWNSGMFIWSLNTIIKSLEKYVPETAETLSPYSKMKYDERASFLEKVYPAIEPISIDYSVMEKADNVYTVKGTFGWSDVGSWRTLEKMIKPDRHNNAIEGDVITVDSSDNIIIGNKRLIALVHIDDLVIIDTDEALLICPKEKTQDVRLITEKLKKQGREDLL